MSLGIDLAFRQNRSRRLTRTLMCRFFSPAVSEEQTRQRFVNTIVKIYHEVGLDGIDIDWEYPAKKGETGNEVSATDSANFLAFLKLLRKTLPADAKISAATQSFPFASPEGLPMTNVTEFATQLDWIVLMNYDVWGCEFMFATTILCAFGNEVLAADFISW